jgi:hypothetical protein
VRHGALAAEVGHRHDRAAAARLHQRLGRARARDERVRADVDGHPEAVARRVDEAALEVLRGCEGDRVDEDVEPAAERLRDLAKDAREVVVGADVALRDERLSTVAARSRTFFSMRSPWYVNATLAPSVASRFAIAHAIERWLATPRTSACLPSNLPAIAAILNG